jgi:hypothetical protein
MAVLKIEEFPRGCVFKPILRGRYRSSGFAGQLGAELTKYGCITVEVVDE